VVEKLRDDTTGNGQKEVGILKRCQKAEIFCDPFRMRFAGAA